MSHPFRLVLAAALACPVTALAASPLGQRSTAIVGGTSSDESRNAVVVVYRGAFLEFCTGFFVAPGWVMTARHCLFGSTLDAQFYETCQVASNSTGTFAWPPNEFSVLVGSEKPLTTRLVAVESYADEALDFCVNDVALLQLETDAGVPPLQLRLDEQPREDEEALLIGWGYTANDEPVLPPRRQERNARVLMLGPDYFDRSERFVSDGAFVTSEGGCIGDDGAPLLSAETGAVIGVNQAALRLDDDVPNERARNCLGAVSLFQGLRDRANWIRSTLRSHGAAPWIEGKRRPEATGASCTDGDECVSGVCVGVGTERLCSESCAERPCPDGMQCVGPDEARVCALTSDVDFDGPPSCAASRPGPHRVSMHALWFTSLLACARHRRRLPKRRHRGGSMSNDNRWLVLAALVLVLASTGCDDSSATTVQALAPGPAVAMSDPTPDAGPRPRPPFPMLVETTPNPGAMPPSSCGGLLGGSTCDPVTAWPCKTDEGETCDYSNSASAFRCFLLPNFVSFCSACDRTSRFCGPTTACGSGRCEQYCCADTDCAEGVCYHDFQEPALAMIGYCAQDSIVACGPPVSEAIPDAPASEPDAAAPVDAGPAGDVDASSNG